MSHRAPDVRRLHAYLEGRLGRRRRARFEAHIETCEACRLGLARLRLLRTTLRAPVDPLPDPDQLAAAEVRIVQRAWGGEEDWIEAMGDGRRRRTLGFLGAGLLAAAAAVVAITVWSGPHEPSDSTPPPPAPVQSASPVAVVVAVEGRVELSVTFDQPARPVSAGDVVPTGARLVVSDDASRARLRVERRADVELGAGTALVLARGVDDRGPIDLVQGRVVVRVEPDDAAPPFFVRTADVEVRVTGTVFSVSHNHASSSEIAVLRGSVEVRDARRPQAKITVRAGRAYRHADPRAQRLDHAARKALAAPFGLSVEPDRPRPPKRRRRTQVPPIPTSRVLRPVEPPPRPAKPPPPDPNREIGDELLRSGQEMEADLRKMAEP